MYYVQQGDMFRDRFISLLASRQGTFTKIGAIGIATNALFSCFRVKFYINITHFFYMF
jgi:hypothetical protein